MALSSLQSPKTRRVSIHAPGYTFRPFSYEDRQVRYEVWRDADTKLLGVVAHAHTGFYTAGWKGVESAGKQSGLVARSFPSALAIAEHLSANIGDLRENIIAIVQGEGEPIPAPAIAKRLKLGARRVKDCCEMLHKDEGVFGFTSDRRYFIATRED